MNPCKRIGIENTWKCNFRCVHCFYLRNSNFKSGRDVPLPQIFQKITYGIEKRDGNHVVLIGYGEPALSKNFIPIIEFCTSKGVASSVITNGTAHVSIYEKAFAAGLDHIHLSMHDIDDRADAITRHANTYYKQRELLEWMKEKNHPWRCNTTIQQENIDNLEEIVKRAIKYGVHHFVFLNFLPHYEWKEHVRECAVHPVIVGRMVERAAELLLESNTLFTIRYFPFCHIDPKFWKYIVNSYYVAWDPWEWMYGGPGDSDVKIAERLRMNVEIESCSECMAYRHCAGWDRNYDRAFGGVTKKISFIPDEYRDIWDETGGVFSLNPANRLSGTIQTN